MLILVSCTTCTGICLKTGPGESRKTHSSTTSLSRSGNMSSSVAYDTTHGSANEDTVPYGNMRATLSQSLPTSTHGSRTTLLDHGRDMHSHPHTSSRNSRRTLNQRGGIDIHVHEDENSDTNARAVSYPTRSEQVSVGKTHDYHKRVSSHRAASTAHPSEQRYADNKVTHVDHYEQEGNYGGREWHDNAQVEHHHVHSNTDTVDTPFNNFLHTPKRSSRRNVRWYDPPKTPDGPLEISRFADEVGELPR